MFIVVVMTFSVMIVVDILRTPSSGGRSRFSKGAVCFSLYLQFLDKGHVTLGEDSCDGDEPGAAVTERCHWVRRAIGSPFLMIESLFTTVCLDGLSDDMRISAD